MKTVDKDEACLFLSAHSALTILPGHARSSLLSHNSITQTYPQSVAKEIVSLTVSAF